VAFLEEVKALLSRAMTETQPARGLGTELVELFSVSWAY
jgi:hypothetical protein